MLDPNQALLTGQVAGLLMRLNAEDQPGSLLDLRIEVDAEGNYTNRIFVTRPSGRYTITVDGPEPAAATGKGAMRSSDDIVAEVMSDADDFERGMAKAEVAAGQRRGSMPELRD